MNYDKVWSLFTSKDYSERAMARASGMSPSGFKSMMEKKTMTVETLETIANHFHLPLHYFFDTSKNEVQEPGQKLNKGQVKIFECPECIEKEKRLEDKDRTIQAQRETIETQKLLISNLRGNQPGLKNGTYE
ncbi:hypothetical protein [Mangrovibacterium sp.]|uniref:hypothetical protein n=1 Tax=Mangrovibacterium sp. TaxID=1961364 RepID=UPI00356A63C4